MDIRTEVVLWKCGCSWIGTCLVDKDKVQGEAVRVGHIRNACFVLFDFFSSVHSVSPTIGESLLRQICGFFVTVPDHRRSAIHQRLDMPWLYGGCGVVCRAFAEGQGRAAWSGVG